MDFDRTSLPAVYDAGRGYSPKTLDRWRAAILHVVGTSSQIHDILDLGCEIR